MEFKHKSVLLEETIEGLNIKPDGIYVDGTLGGAGHAREVCKKLSAKGRFIGIDQDQDAIIAASERLAPFKQATVIRSNYCYMVPELAARGINKVDGILLDLGVSSYQLDNEERGFTYRVDAPLDMRQSSKITNEFAKRLGMSEEQLFKCAAENTRRLFPPVVRSMNDIMKEMFARDGMPQEIAEMMIAEIPPEQTMWVISNENGINGAASMLYENELHELAESLESDLYILPSSVHEVIAVSSDMGSPEMLAQMVVEVNMQEVSLDERLSNQVYHYDKDLRKLTLATDTPNKRLDGIVAEPPLVYDAKEKSR